MFKFIKQKKNNNLNCEGVSATLTAADHAKIVDKFFRIVNTTYDFQEFLEAYKKVIYHHMFVVTFWRDRGGDADIEELWINFNNDKGIYITDFLYRCYEKGVLVQQREIILNYQNELTDGNIQYMENLLKPTVHLNGSEHAKIVHESFKVMNTTYDFQEFLHAYKNVLYHQGQLAIWWRSRGGDADTEDNLKEFTLGKEIYINEFFDRCYNNGVLNQNKDLILNCPDELTSSNIKYLEELLIGSL